MDFAQYDFDRLASEGIEVAIPDPFDPPGTPAPEGAPVITVIGKDSSKWKEISRKVLDAHGIGKEATVAEVTDVMPEVLAAATLSWSDDIEWNGKKLKCTEKNALKLYKACPWVLEAVMKSAVDRDSLKKKLSLS